MTGFWLCVGSITACCPLVVVRDTVTPVAKGYFANKYGCWDRGVGRRHLAVAEADLLWQILLILIRSEFKFE